MSDVQTAETALNTMLASGQIVEAVERWYHPDVSMQENLGHPTKGKAANLLRENGVFGARTHINHFNLIASVVDGDRSYSEWDVDLVLGSGQNLKMTQVARRIWKDGLVIDERFYYDPKSAQ